MANLSIPAPIEPEKSDWLHDRDNRPKGPGTSRVELLKRFSGLIAGSILAVALTAVLFSLRDSWGNHREWLVTMIPFIVLAGLALSYLALRREWVAMAPGIFFLFFALLFGFIDILADNDEAATDTLRDTMSILGGIALGIATACFVVAVIWVEARKPFKAPQPEL